MKWVEVKFCNRFYSIARWSYAYPHSLLEKNSINLVVNTLMQRYIYIFIAQKEGKSGGEESLWYIGSNHFAF